MPNFLDALVDNPVMHALGHAAGSLWNMTNLAQSLRAAADQHQQLQQQMRLHDADLAMRQQQQQFGREQTQYSDLANALSTGGRMLAPGETAGRELPGAAPAPIGETRLKPVENPANVLTVPGGQRVYYPDASEQAARSQNERVGLQSALNQANERPIPDQWADDYGLARGTRVPQTGYDTMLGRVMSAKERAQQAADKPEKPDPTQLLTGYDTPLEYNKATHQITPLKMPEGVNRLPSANQEEINARFQMSRADRAAQRAQSEADREENRRQAQANRDRANQEAEQLRHDKIYQSEQDAWELSQRYDDAAATKGDGKKILDPRTGKEVPLTDERRKAYAALSKDTKRKAADLQKQSKEIRKRMGWGEFGQQQPQQQQAPPDKAAPAQPKGNAQRIRVKIGDKTGTIDASQFDPATMTRLE